MIRIITDSTSDLSAQAAKTLGIDIVPLTVHFGEESYRDGVEITPAEFFEKLSKAAELPTTSQINPEEFIAKFQGYVDAGDEVVGIFLSSDLSGTCQSAHIAKTAVGGERVFVVDSRTVTFGLGLLVTVACRLRDEGKTAAEIAAECTRLTGKIRLFAALDTLKYLKMGGRISPTTAMVGGLLGISPIVSVAEGKVEAAGKARGRKGALGWIAKTMESCPPDLTYGIAFGHTAAPEAMAECMARFPELLGAAPFVITGEIGSVVGTHGGPGAAGIAYFEK
ncbi:MAG: DegV family protein [Oscillospiraceae bacterium]